MSMIPTTPEEFEQRNPNWREDARVMCRTAILQMSHSPEMPQPWDEETVRMIEEVAMTSTIDIFRQYRESMGNRLFGELVLLVGEEAKRVAKAVRDGENLESRQ